MNKDALPRGRLLLLVAAIALGSGCSTPAAQTWNLQWSDEFNGAPGSVPDPAAWSYDTGAGGWGNGELETYCAPSSAVAPCVASEPNVFMDGKGHLVIRVRKMDGAWTSGRMKTQGKKEFQYGRIEARMKLVASHGLWPAFWMLGSNLSAAGWPKAGEQDIMEWVQAYGPGTTSSTVHGPGYSGGKGIGSKFTFPEGGRIDDAEFHTYGVIWSEDRLQFYRDNPMEPYFTLTPAQLPAGATWVYNQPFFLLLNFAIGGGGFPGVTDASTRDSADVLVDFVRVYRASDTVTPSAWYGVSARSGGRCLQAGGNSGRQAQVEGVACKAGEAAQAWRMTPAGAGFYTVVNRRGDLLRTGVDPAEAAGRGRASRAPEQAWKPVPLGDGTVELVDRDNGLCLTGQAAAAPEIAGPEIAGPRPRDVRFEHMMESACSGSREQAFSLTQQP